MLFMKIHPSALIFSALLLCSLEIGAERITKVAVLDYTRILSSFYSDSAEARRIDQMKQDFADEVRMLQEEIQSLEEEKLDASDRGNSRESLDFDAQIQEKKQYYRDYIRVRGNQIRNAAANLSSSNALAQEILSAIEYVAEVHGYSLVLKRSAEDLLWWDYQIDITEPVLERLMGSN